MTFDWSHLTSGGIGGSLVAIPIIIKALAKGRFRLSFGNGNGNGTESAKPGASAAMPVEFWVAKFEGLDVHAQAQTRILERQTDLLQEQTKLLTELVTVSRIRSGIGAG